MRPLDPRSSRSRSAGTSDRVIAARRHSHPRTQPGEGTASRLADQIRRYLIDPEVERIRERLSTADKMLAKKTAVGVGLGSLVTVCGLLAGVNPPLATVAGWSIVGMRSNPWRRVFYHLNQNRSRFLCVSYFTGERDPDGMHADCRFHP